MNKCKLQRTNKIICGWKHVKVGQYVILVFYSESSHQIYLNIKSIEMFF